MGFRVVARGIGRVFLALIFFIAGINHIITFGKTVEFMRSRGVWAPDILLGIAIVFVFVGVFFLLFERSRRLGTFLLLVYIFPVTLIFHSNWSDGTELTQFLKNTAIIGGLLYVMTSSSSSKPYHVDGVSKTTTKKATKKTAKKRVKPN